MRERRRILFSGRVQGVGFRATAEWLASRRPVTGYVRNLDSGEVELVVEGEPADIDAMLADLGRSLGANIHTQDVKVSPATSEFESFEIRR